MSQVRASQVRVSQVRASLGTCMALGLEGGRCDVYPTTAYLLVGDRCRRSCAFCAQSALSRASDGQLSRVSWPEVELDELVRRLPTSLDDLSPLKDPSAESRPSEGDRSCDGSSAGAGVCSRGSSSLEEVGVASEGANLEAGAGRAGVAPQSRAGIRRICLQVTDSPESHARLKRIIPVLNSKVRLPICVSYKPESLEAVGEMLRLGADRVSIALDAADPEVYASVKGGSYDLALGFISSAAEAYPGRLSTHLIIGMGETEESAIRLIARLVALGVGVALFAFTPVRGTPMEHNAPPELGQYRRVQVARHLLVNGLVTLDQFSFTEGTLVHVDCGRFVLEMIRNGEAFRTSGCKDCNRPYYNERPGSLMYNYPRPLTPDEAKQALLDTGLWKDDLL